MKLLSLKPEGKFIFVGDTHGDLGASIQIIENYSKVEQEFYIFFRHTL